MSLWTLVVMLLAGLQAKVYESTIAFLVMVVLGVVFVFLTQKEPETRENWRYTPGFVLIALGAFTPTVFRYLTYPLGVLGLFWMALALFGLDRKIVDKFEDLTAWLDGANEIPVKIKPAIAITMISLIVVGLGLVASRTGSASLWLLFALGLICLLILVAALDKRRGRKERR